MLAPGTVGNVLRALLLPAARCFPACWVPGNSARAANTLAAPQLLPLQMQQVDPKPGWLLRWRVLPGRATRPLNICKTISARRQQQGQATHATASRTCCHEGEEVEEGVYVILHHEGAEQAHQQERRRQLLRPQRQACECRMWPRPTLLHAGTWSWHEAA